MDIRRRMFFKKNGGSYTVDLNDQWEATTAVPNPDSTLYDGVYRSASNYNVNNGVATMYITIKDYSSFKIYIRSYAELSFDYVMISQLDQTIDGNTDYSNRTLVKAHTRNNQQSGTTLSNYTLVEFTEITPGEHTITVVYRKDVSSHSGDDRGYVLIGKTQAGGDSGGGEDVIPEPIINIDNYLTIEALENELTAKLSINECEYCVDGDGNWKTLYPGLSTDSINKGHRLSFRGNLTPNGMDGIGAFTISKKCNLKGNCMSMLFGDNAANNYSLSGKGYAFCQLFFNCTNIVNVSSNFLPATNLSEYCYCGIFAGCTNLQTAPKLPALEVCLYSYGVMFHGCSNLTTAPELPATTLANYCYRRMFYGCSNLTTAPELPATSLFEYCYDEMFYGCSNLTTAPELPATTLAKYCYRRMFYGCSNLTTAPELPAMTLPWYCYYEMFRECTKITYVPVFAKNYDNLIDIGWWSCYQMFYKCTSMDFNKNISTVFKINSIGQAGCAGMFSSCSNLTNSNNITPIIIIPDHTPNTVTSNYGEAYASMFQNCSALMYTPIAALVSDMGDTNCYNSMFYGCKKLRNVPTLTMEFTSGSVNCCAYMFYGCSSLTSAAAITFVRIGQGCCQYMFQNCTSLTTAPNLRATTLFSECYKGMFDGCTNLNYIKMLATDISAQDCLTDWVNNVATVGTFVKNSAMTTLPSGTSGIPSGWTVQNATS